MSFKNADALFNKQTLHFVEV